ncbi:be34ec7d-0e68-46fe-bb6a-05f4e13c29ca [Echria macrotheca]|uniref:Be34ec7d-0e68-46fe-bb6a-05f4e13c29ca n=1 Tax=Echria macrotheca TaxID=438768 RepID=A0AAJ0BNS9_9PEZI|nr:be34ec7d-0e68-46fe-bb6a-05f4e13c29ca [Echria macrotheca]
MPTQAAEVPGGSDRRVPAPQPPQSVDVYEQDYYAFGDGSWAPVSDQNAPDQAAPGVFSVMSWNIDFMRPLENERMKAALDYLGSNEWRKRQPTILLFNEMLPSDLQLIQNEDWVREGYYLTDATIKNWGGDYGTCMLVPRCMPIQSVFRVPYRSGMGRDALFVDISLPGDKKLRAGTTHLESLRRKPPVRPTQLALAADFMKLADAAILGGDMNAIQEFDKTLHVDNGLKDAYLENGGVEGAADGMTWGQMAETEERERFGLGRLDKLFFCGDVELVPQGFRTFGADVVLEGQAGQDLIREVYGTLDKPWVTDHLGIMADFRIPTGGEVPGSRPQAGS